MAAELDIAKLNVDDRDARESLERFIAQWDEVGDAAHDAGRKIKEAESDTEAAADGMLSKLRSIKEEWLGIGAAVGAAIALIKEYIAESDKTRSQIVERRQLQQYTGASQAEIAAIEAIAGERFGFDASDVRGSSEQINAYLGMFSERTSGEFTFEEGTVETRAFQTLGMTEADVAMSASLRPIEQLDYYAARVAQAQAAGVSETEITFALGEIFSGDDKFIRHLADVRRVANVSIGSRSAGYESSGALPDDGYTDQIFYEELLRSDADVARSLTRAQHGVLPASQIGPGVGDVASSLWRRFGTSGAEAREAYRGDVTIYVDPSSIPVEVERGILGDEIGGR